MKYRMASVTLLLIMGLALTQLAACSMASRPVSAPITYWKEDPKGVVIDSPEDRSYATLIMTSDLARLQKIVPFTIILPEYLPDGPKSYQLNLGFSDYDGVPELSAYYYPLSEAAKEIHVTQGPPDDPYPRPLPPGWLAQEHFTYVPVKLAGLEVLEKAGFDYVVRSANWTQVSAFLYIWEMGTIGFSAKVKGYEQAEARRIIESMIQ